MIKTPVVLIGYARPKETLDIIKMCRLVKPTKFYFIVDAPKNDEVKVLNQEVKNLVNEIDWDCDLHTYFIEKNVGPFEAYNIAMDFTFKQENRLIFLEDDKLPSMSFFYFCEELLEVYENDKRILFISGLNGRQIYPTDYNYDYFFTGMNTSWGHALWKRTYDQFKDALQFINDDYYKNQLIKLYKLDGDKHNFQKEINNYVKYGRNNGHNPSMEFYLMGPLKYLTNSLVIVPTKNLISDVGATLYTVHGDEYKMMTKRQKKWYFRETYELDFPLKHPPYVVKDLTYLSNKSVFDSLIFFVEKVERMILILRFKGLRGLISKITTRIRILLNRDYLK